MADDVERSSPNSVGSPETQLPPLPQAQRVQEPAEERIPSKLALRAQQRQEQAAPAQKPLRLSKPSKADDDVSTMGPQKLPAMPSLPTESVSLETMDGKLNIIMKRLEVALSELELSAAVRLRQVQQGIVPAQAVTGMGLANRFPGKHLMKEVTTSTTASGQYFPETDSEFVFAVGPDDDDCGEARLRGIPQVPSTTKPVTMGSGQPHVPSSKNNGLFPKALASGQTGLADGELHEDKNASRFDDVLDSYSDQFLQLHRDMQRLLEVTDQRTSGTTCAAPVAFALQDCVSHSVGFPRNPPAALSYDEGKGAPFGHVVSTVPELPSFEKRRVSKTPMTTKALRRSYTGDTLNSRVSRQSKTSRTSRHSLHRDASGTESALHRKLMDARGKLQRNENSNGSKEFPQRDCGSKEPPGDQSRESLRENSGHHDRGRQVSDESGGAGSALAMRANARASKISSIEPPPIEAVRARLSKVGGDSIELEEEMDKKEIMDTLFNKRATTKRSMTSHIIWSILEDSESSKVAHYYAMLMPVLLCISVMVTFAQTFPSNPLDGMPTTILENALSSIFTLELMLRFMVWPNRWLFLTNGFNLIDAMAALPLVLRIYVGFSVPSSEATTEDKLIRFVLLGVNPMLRLMKMLRYMENFTLLLSATGLVLEALPTMTFVLVVQTWFFASLIYFVEPRDNIPQLYDAMWLTIVTMTTVGYGDITPASDLGRVVVSFLVVFSVMYMAMPLGIIGDAVTKVWNDRDRILLVWRTRERLAQWGYSAEDIPHLFKHFDKNGSGELNLFAFRELMHSLQMGLKDARVVELFQSIDVDSGGTIDDEEFIKHLFPSTYHEMYAKAMEEGEDGDDASGSGSEFSEEEEEED
eukprot:TRINITY_DN80402_c0_g1_i1.p1 TRINITY_DN80402_c0_g1~~TRINITY_DN80402_c0_g1_i1.p1  ORF type:complete len:881 (-),score=150.89 TRINITY_DN80402_c0_g1_i1:184-2787(-)